MNIIFFILLILILTLTLFLANVNINVTEGYKNKAMDYADSSNSKTSNDFSPTSADIKYDAKTYDSSATIKPDTTLAPFIPNDNYNLQYPDNTKSQDVSGNWSKTLGNFTYNEPGSLRFGSSNYVPNYEESIFLSPVTGLRYNQPMYIESAKDVGFCEFDKNNIDKIEEQCRKLDKNVCASTGCCVLLGGSKCVAGNINGPALKSNYGDTLIRNKDQYYHQGKCYGNCSKTDNSKTNYDYDFTPTPTPSSSSSQTKFTSYSTPTPTGTSSSTPTPSGTSSPTPTPSGTSSQTKFTPT